MNESPSSRPVAIWLLTGVVMIMIQVMLGGITRLTGSGLSITEWKPILGTIPPLNDHDWQIAFDKYKEIGQYKQINFHFTLSDFKSIYFWEWLHRVWARLIALAFAIPFIIFLLQKRFRKDMVMPLVVLFLMGGFIGAIGWIMVATGLNQENVYVSHYALALHFITAMTASCYALWFALKLTVPENQIIRNTSLKKSAIAIIVILAIQLVYGAFMAGLKAAVAAPTWPTINGTWLPHAETNHPFNDPLNVQFIHRMLAYVLTLLILAWWWKARSIRGGRWFVTARSLPLFLVLVQVTLGVLTVLYSTHPKSLIWLGVSHQCIGMLLLLSWTQVLFIVRK